MAQMGGMNMGGGGMKPQIILLKEGTDTSQGKAQLISNINACAAVSDIVRTTLGPRGMDKLMHKDGKVTVSNDGATIMKTLDIVHPAAQCLVDIAKSQDSEVHPLPNFLPQPAAPAAENCTHVHMACLLRLG